MTSDFKKDALDMKEKLGNSMCLAKWNHTNLQLTTGHTNSCYHPPQHKIIPESLLNNVSALHNTEYKKQQRKMMLGGIRPPECDYCWQIENNGDLSDRHYRSGERWSSIDYQKIVTSDWDDDFVPSYVEVNFNSVCNLMCSYCSPQYSTSWMAHAKKHGPYPTTVPHNDPGYFTGARMPIPNREYNPYIEAFWKWWPELYQRLIHFRMTGGEPLLDKNTYKVFDYVIENPKSNLHLNVTSNFSVDDITFDKYLRYTKKICNVDTIEHFMQFVSIDTFGNQAEYIRMGLDFDKVIHRVDRWLTEVDSRNSLTFIITMNNLTISRLQLILEFILKMRERHSTSYQRVWFDTPQLHFPAWQSMRILPDAYAWKLEQIVEWMKLNSMNAGSFTGFKDYEIEKIISNIKWMRNTPSDVESKRVDFYRFFSEYDRRHNVDFLSVFPEMDEFWNLCKYLSEQKDKNARK